MDLYVLYARLRIHSKRRSLAAINIKVIGPNPIAERPLGSNSRHILALLFVYIDFTPNSDDIVPNPIIIRSQSAMWARLREISVRSSPVP
jgi:hypothetical protein